MNSFAELYADTIKITSDRTAGGSYSVHCWFSAETAYLPIICRTLAHLKHTVKAVQAACVADGNVKPVFAREG